MEPFIGQLQTVGFNFAPRGWALCNGQLLPISQNQALFSLIGTTYGGDGRTNFALPDLRGRVAEHVGTGPGLSPRTWGQRGGSPTATLTVNNLPSHTHQLRGRAETADANKPENNVYAVESINNIYGTGNADINMGGTAILATGGGQSFSIEQPFLGINWCIALTGVFPSRS